MSSLTITGTDEKRVKALGFLRNKGTDNFSGRIITKNGKITAAQNKCISEAAELYGNGIITFTSRLTVEVQGIPYNKIEDFRTYIAKEGLETGGTGSKVRPVVSCKGTVCRYGLIDTFALSEEIHERFYNGYADVKLPHKFKIGVGGCPNNCMKPDLNDLGIVGQKIPCFETEDCMGCKKCIVEQVCPMGAAKATEDMLEIDKTVCNNCGLCVGQCPFDVVSDYTVGYKIFLGGRWGKKIAIGKPLDKIFTNKEDVLDTIEKTILLYREQGKTGERLSETIARIGFENVQKQLFSDDLLKRKQAILVAELHMTGGASC
ncbi:MAG: 4Fe-4S binding protein [Clostridia bacterium]|jgi:dissimilatory sulfite reductase (desulfoviridin) alpha/beta subunit|nr:4Fe-4S binding protein [Clostridiaceae bacterium]